MTQQEELAVTWRSGDAEGSTDYLPLEDFLKDGSKRRCKHRVTKGAWQDWAWYDAVITGRQALLDYRPYAKLNDANGMELGILRVTFGNDERTKISTYEWQSKDSRHFDRITITQVVPQPGKIPPYQPLKASAEAQQRKAKPRLGQIKFKRQLMLAYGGRCCITGCDVSEALDGAHIDPYQNDSHDHPSNGLLLRKDLHALFDCRLLAVEPSTRHVVFADQCLAYPEYARLHRRTTLGGPVTGFRAYGPDQAAVERRWRAFQKPR